jgi:glycosyltransferase involved in cell wall biosynthesis
MEDKILALIPAHNEAPRIGAVVTGVLRYLPVLVLDDGSTDETGAVARAARAAVVRQQPNQGKGRALKAGLRHALEQGYDAVLTLDGDGQHDPEDIPAFMEAWKAQGPDLLIGLRDFQQMPAVRRLANTLGRVTFSWAMGRRIPDNQSGYRMLSRRMIEAVLKSGEAGFEFEVEMIVTCLGRGYRLAWVPIRTIYAGESSHIHPWHHTVNFLRLLWETRRSRPPRFPPSPDN